MPTKPIPSGTCNFPVNMPRALRGKIGRLARLERAPSVGAWIRMQLEHRVEAAERSGADVRPTPGQRWLPLCFSVCLGLGLGGAVAGWILHPDQPVRRRREESFLARVIRREDVGEVLL